MNLSGAVNTSLRIACTENGPAVPNCRERAHRNAVMERKGSANVHIRKNRVSMSLVPLGAPRVTGHRYISRLPVGPGGS